MIVPNKKQWLSVNLRPIDKGDYRRILGFDNRVYPTQTLLPQLIWEHGMRIIRSLVWSMSLVEKLSGFVHLCH